MLNRYNADIDCQTNLGYSPLHRCAFYNHPRLASLFVLAGASQHLRDKDNETAYEVAVKQKNKDFQRILKPLISETGENISGIMYATNNPKHPNHRPEGREAFFSLFDAEYGAEEEEGEEEGELEDDDGEWEDIDDDDDEEGDEENEDSEEEENDNPPSDVMI